jgi:hypothetical protein
MCLYNQRKYGAAKTAFREAEQVRRSRRTAAQWIRVINADIARNEQIRLAEEAARKKRRELNARKEQNQRV